MVVIALVLAAWGQAPSETWKVIDTPSYRIHYPEPAEAWTLEAASRVEAARARVAEAVGWSPPFKVQVVVTDPMSMANGMVIPLGRSPRMELWTTPAGAADEIGHYRDPFEDLIVHEDVHVVHMSLPPRGLSGLLMLELFRVGPIAVKSPRWVLEGYATVIEGSASGSGRPYGDLRGVTLRRLAQAGELPTYGELSGSERWRGMGFAYLAGSAYLEWLEARAGEGSLRALWARMTAKKVRTFDEAFEGVFGEGPAVLYRRFTAELTAEAMRADGSDRDRSTLWLDTSGSVGSPAVSPDGSKLAAVQFTPGKPGALVVWRTGVDEEAVKRRAEELDEILARDPDDVRPVDPAHPPREELYRLPQATHPPFDPRWLGDDALVFTSLAADPSGRRRWDLFRYDLSADRVRRLTRGADLRMVDPLPDGSAAIGLQSRWGATGLVRVDLSTGHILPLTPPSVTAIVDQPRVSPDGSRLLWLQHDGDRFRAMTGTIDASDPVELATPDGARVLHVAWSPDGEVIASLGVEGRIDLWRLGERPARLTSSGAALAPAPAADGTYFLELQSDGYEIHHLPSDAPEVPAPDAPLALVGRPPPVDAPPLARQAVTSQRFGLGRMEGRPLVGGSVGHRAATFELGLRLGDVVGRNELVVLGSAGDAGGVSGGGARWVNRTLPAVVELRAWGLLTGFEGPFATGGSVELAAARRGSASGIHAQGGAWGERLSDGRSRGALFGAASVSAREKRRSVAGGWLAGAGALGRTDQTTALGELGAGFDLWRGLFSSRYEIGFARGEPFSLGGVTSAVRADAAQWNQLRVGWAAPGTALGTVHDAMSAAITLSGIQAFVERRRLWDEIGRQPFAIAGLRVEQSVASQPLVRIPGMAVTMGVGCVFEAGVIVDKPCQSLDHYRGWSGLVWRR